VKQRYGEKKGEIISILIEKYLDGFKKQQIKRIKRQAQLLGLQVV